MHARIRVVAPGADLAGVRIHHDRIEGVGPVAGSDDLAVPSDHLVRGRMGDRSWAVWDTQTDSLRELRRVSGEHLAENIELVVVGGQVPVTQVPVVVPAQRLLRLVEPDRGRDGSASGERETT